MHHTKSSQGHSSRVKLQAVLAHFSLCVLRGQPLAWLVFANSISSLTEFLCSKSIAGAIFNSQLISNLPSELETAGSSIDLTSLNTLEPLASRLKAVHAAAHAVQVRSCFLLSLNELLIDATSSCGLFVRPVWEWQQL